MAVSDVLVLALSMLTDEPERMPRVLREAVHERIATFIEAELDYVEKGPPRSNWRPSGPLTPELREALGAEMREFAAKASDGGPAAPRAKAALVERLVSLFGDSIYGFCRRFLREPAAADDACQWVFVRVLDRLPDFAKLNGFSEMRQWLFTTARNRCIDMRRRMPAGEEDDEGGHSPSGEDALADRERVFYALGRLKPKHREVLVLYAIEGFRFPEIAAMCGETASTLQKRFEDAKKQLQRHLTRLEGARGASRAGASRPA